MTTARSTADAGLLLACLDELRMGVAVFDANQALVLHNPRFSKLMRLPEHLMRPGTRYIDIVKFNRERGVVNETDHDHKAETRLDVGGGHRASYRATLLLPWNHVMTMRLHPLPEGGFMITYRRITRRRAAEQRAAAALEEAHAAAEAAEFANRSKTEFLANMSHELRTPLNAIIGFAEIMSSELKGPLGAPEYKEYAADIADSSQHLLNIINDLLDISKIEAGKLELREENVDIEHAIDTTFTVLRGRAEAGGVTLTKGKIPDDIYLCADSRLIRQILLNLASNAIKFTPEGGQVSLSARHEPDGHLAIAISDTGIGIAAQDIELALMPFTQIDSALSRRHVGTGLGLPLTKALVELHGGTLEIASEPGTGTTATVHIPAARVMARKDKAPVAQSRRPQ